MEESNGFDARLRKDIIEPVFVDISGVWLTWSINELVS